MTVPVGVPVPGAVAVTVAVKVTDWPETEGLTEEATAVVVLAALTAWVKFGEVLPLELASPLYTAGMVWAATEREVGAPLVALGAAEVTGAPKLAPSSW